MIDHIVHGFFFIYMQVIAHICNRHRTVQQLQRPVVARNQRQNHAVYARLVRSSTSCGLERFTESTDTI